MDAKTYLEGHWMKNEVWTHLSYSIHQERLKKCADAVAGGKAFVDIGCGLGHSTAIMKGFCPGDWTGVDFGESAIAEARKLFPDIKFLLPQCGRCSEGRLGRSGVLGGDRARRRPGRLCPGARECHRSRRCAGSDNSEPAGF